MIISIWDVDGCIVQLSKLEKDEKKNEIIIRNQPLCIPFCNFVKKKCQSGKNFIVTGRKFHAHGDITENILKEIFDDAEKEKTIYFPKDKTYDLYESWKTEKIKEIISNHQNDEFYIYDDNESIIKSLYNYDQKNVHLYIVKSNTSEFNLISI